MEPLLKIRTFTRITHPNYKLLHWLKIFFFLASHGNGVQLIHLFSTNEVIIILSGKMTLTLYDLDLNKIEDVILESGDMVALFNGGHEIRIEEQTKFIEVKQGPYSEEKDKTRF